MISRIFKIVFSVCFTRIINVSGSFFSIMMVGYLGKTELAAAFLALLSVNIILVINLSILQGLNPLVRQYLAEKKSLAELGHLIRQGYIIALGYAFISSFILWHLSDLLFLFRQDPHLIVLTIPYFHFAAFSIFPALILSVFSQVNLGTGQFRVVLLTESISMLLKLASSYSFISGRFGLPAMGITGIAMADLCVNIIVFVFIVIYISKASYYRTMNLLSASLFRSAPTNFSIIDKSCCRSILTLGLPIAIQTGGEFSAIIISIFLMGYYGVNALAALQVANQYLTVCLIFGFGFTQALTLLVREAMYQKRGNELLIIQYIKTAMGMALLFNVPVALLFVLKPFFLLSLFIHVEHVDSLFLAYCKDFFAVNAVLIVLDSVRSILTGALRGLNDARASMWIGLFSLWCISLPLSYLCLVLNLGPVGVRLGLVFGFLIWVLLSGQRLLKALVWIAEPVKGTEMATVSY